MLSGYILTSSKSPLCGVSRQISCRRIFLCKKDSLGKLYACQTLVSKGFGSPYFLCFDFITYSPFSKKNKSETQKFDFLRNVRCTVKASLSKFQLAHRFWYKFLTFFDVLAVFREIIIHDDLRFPKIQKPSCITK